MTGVSGSGKTTLILESLVPALEAAIAGTPLPPHVKNIDASGIRTRQAHRFDTHRCQRALHGGYLRRYSRRAAQDLRPHAPDARASGYKAGDFSYNTGRLRCPVCDGTGTVSLDVQFLPDVDIPCPECRGSRYAKPAGRIACTVGNGRSFTLPQVHGRPTWPMRRSCAPDSRASHRACDAERPRVGLPHPRRSHAQSLGRRGAAAETRLGDGTPAKRLALRFRRAHHRAPPARRQDIAQKSSGICFRQGLPWSSSGTIWT